MSSFFKGSCVICWITWLLCFSVLVGTTKLIDAHIYQDSYMRACLVILEIVCYSNIMFAMIGCVFLKCDISHILCATCYLVPVGIIIPTLSIYGVVKTSSPNSLTTPSPAQLLTALKAHLVKYNGPPPWLYYTEEELKCCGIKGPSDYRNIYRQFANCKTFEDDIPCSCCVRRVKLNLSERQYYGELLSCINTGNLSACWDSNNSVEWLKHVVFTQSNNVSNISIDDKCDSQNTEEFMVDPLLNATAVSFPGCYNQIKHFYELLKQWLFVFFIMFTICSFLMAAAYMRNFCNSEHFIDNKSQHSLDVETLSLLDIPPVNTTLASGDKDMSNQKQA